MQKLRRLINLEVNLCAVVFCSVLTVISVKATMLLPGQYYFTFSGFLFSGDVATSDLLRPGSAEDAYRDGFFQPNRGYVLEKSWISLLIKLAIPGLSGFVMALLWAPSAQVTSARVAGFLSAFLLTWPALLYWDAMAVPPSLYKRNAFLVIYVLYWVAYMLISGAGAQLGSLVSSSTKMDFNLGDAITQSIYGIATTGLCVGAIYAFTD